MDCFEFFYLLNVKQFKEISLKKKIFIQDDFSRFIVEFFPIMITDYWYNRILSKQKQTSTL